MTARYLAKLILWGGLAASLLAGCYNPGTHVMGAQVHSGTLEEGTYYRSEDGRVSFRVPFAGSGGGFSRMEIHARSMDGEFQIVVLSHGLPAEVYRVSITDHAEALGYDSREAFHQRLSNTMVSQLESEYDSALKPVSSSLVGDSASKVFEQAFIQSIGSRGSVLSPGRARALEVAYLGAGFSGERCEAIVWINWPFELDEAERNNDIRDYMSPEVYDRVNRFLDEFKLHC